MDATDVTLGEIVRSLTDLREEIRALRGEHVRRDLYEAHRAEIGATLGRLEDQLRARDEERTMWRRQITLAVVSAGLSMLVTLVVAVVR